MLDMGAGIHSMLIADNEAAEQQVSASFNTENPGPRPREF
jgi:hypothetical protein